MLNPDQDAYVAIAAHRLASENDTGEEVYRVIRAQLMIASDTAAVQTDWGVRLPSPEVSLRLVEELMHLSPVMGKIGLRLVHDDYMGCWTLPLLAERDDRGRARYPKIYDATRKQPVVAHRYL